MSIQLVVDLIACLAGTAAVLDYFGIKPKQWAEGGKWSLSRKWKLAIMLTLVGTSLGMSGYSFYRARHPLIVEKIVEKPVDRVVEKLVPANCPKVAPVPETTRKESPQQPTVSSFASLHSPPIGTVTQGPGSAFSNNQQGGVTAGTYVSDILPRPGVVPNVTFCINQLVDGVIKISTDTEITAPFWGLIFDGPVSGATVEMGEANHDPFGMSAAHPLGWKLGQLTDPLRGFPSESRLLIGADENTRVLTDNVLRIQINAIGNPFGGPYRPWGPKDHLLVKLQSAQSVHLLAIVSGSGRALLPEHMTLSCAD